MQRFDGVLVGVGDGTRLFVTFDPAWWHLRRWMGWWLELLRAKVQRGRESLAVGKVSFNLNGRQRMIRVIENRAIRLPNVPGPDALEIKGPPGGRIYRHGGFFRIH